MVFMVCEPKVGQAWRVAAPAKETVDRKRKMAVKMARFWWLIVASTLVSASSVIWWCGWQLHVPEVSYSISFIFGLLFFRQHSFTLSFLCPGWLFLDRFRVRFVYHSKFVSMLFFHAENKSENNEIKHSKI